MENTRKDTTGLELEIVVKPGTVTQNFDAFKEMVRNELETKYKNIEVSEESLKEAKSARARLNKAKQSLKDAMRSAQLENDRPLVVPKAQAKELEYLLDEAIETLDSQIKRIEEDRKSAKLDECAKRYFEAFKDATAEVKEIADRCAWIRKKEWVNVTYPLSNVEADCKKARKRIESALKLLKGDFAPQMLEHFILNGSVTEAQEEGQRLADIKEQNDRFVSPLKTEEKDIKEKKVIRPEAFVESGLDLRKGSVDMRFSGMLYQIKWIRHICEAEKISLEVIKKENSK